VAYVAPHILSSIVAAFLYCLFFASCRRSGGQAAFLLSVTITNPDLSSASAVAALASVATNALAQAALAGDMNSASQVIGPITQMLNTASQAQNSSEAIAQRAAIREQLFLSVLSIASTSGPISVSAASQSLAAISAISSNPAELSPAVATAAAEFAAQSIQALLASSKAPLPPLIVSSALNIAGSCAAASSFAGENGNSSEYSRPRISSEQQKQIRYYLLFRS
jgi:hypothetical protein